MTERGIKTETVNEAETVKRTEKGTETVTVTETGTVTVLVTEAGIKTETGHNGKRRREKKP